VDIFYDHFLAKNWADYHTQPLEDYAQYFYSLLKNNQHVLTERTKGIMPHMITHDWLSSYATIEGISRILVQMVHRTKNKSGMGHSVKELREFYTEFEAEFKAFFEAVQAFSKEKLAEL
jgi:acyl carrier protein phosphodiesterase